VVWKSGNITGNTARSGGGVYVDDNSEFDFMTGSISGNTATGATAVSAHFTHNTIDGASIAGGGGVYVNGDSIFWLKNGGISNNHTAGSGGGVLVNGSAIPESPTADDLPHNFLMSGGSVNSNTATGGVWPHGGGGVFVAKGAFEMLNGTISSNTATRQGGGVFVWSRALFVMSGNSSVIANDGVGSSKAICNRGITRMEGKAQADKVYVWNYLKGAWNYGAGDEFTLTGGARAADVMLAFADDPEDNRNYVSIVLQPTGQFFTGADTITTIYLESRLTKAGKFDTEATIEGDWIGHHLIKYGNGATIPAAQAAALVKRFPLGNFTYGKTPSISLSGYTLDHDGKLQKK
jgi:hypothetical protein